WCPPLCLATYVMLSHLTQARYQKGRVQSSPSGRSALAATTASRSYSQRRPARTRGKSAGRSRAHCLTEDSPVLSTAASSAAVTSLGGMGPTRASTSAGVGRVESTGEPPSERRAVVEFRGSR